MNACGNTVKGIGDDVPMRRPIPRHSGEAVGVIRVERIPVGKDKVVDQIADDVGKIKQGIVEIEKLPLQQDLANMAGTSRETISRTLHSFAKKGLVELEGSKLRILDYEKFKETFA